MLTHTTLAALRLQTSSLLQFTAQADSSGLLTFADFLVPFASLCTYMHALRVPGQLLRPSASSGQGLVFPIGECTHARSQPTLKTYPDLFALSQERPPLDYYRTPTPVDRTALSVGIQPATLSACDSPSPATLTLKHIVECRHQTSRFAVRGADSLKKIQGGIGAREREVIRRRPEGPLVSP